MKQEKIATKTLRHKRSTKKNFGETGRQAGFVALRLCGKKNDLQVVIRMNSQKTKGIELNMDNIFKIRTQSEFKALALKTFRLQAEKNPVYKNYLKQINIRSKGITEIKNIPFLPIEFFKTQPPHPPKGGVSGTRANNAKTKQKLFISSGTTSGNRSHHLVSDISLYEKSFTKGFELFYGNIEDYCLLALLPSYLENKNSSLVYMVNNLIKKTKNAESGFFLKNYKALSKKLELLTNKKQKTILLGVSHALLDFSETAISPLWGAGGLIIMETGGMKGARKELVRDDLHQRLCAAFGVKKIHSEYGMTELLSQAYSKGSGLFYCPPWMKILIRDTNDNFEFLSNGQTGGINIIDLANIHSCSFIATQDLGKCYSDGSFEVLGRFDNSDVRGCNMLIA